MSKIDKKSLKIKLYDSDTDTETEVAVKVEAEKPKKHEQVASLPNSVKFSPQENDGRLSRTDHIRVNRMSPKHSDEENSKASSVTSTKNKPPTKINHFSRPKNTNEKKATNSSSDRSNSPPKNSPSNSSNSDSSIRISSDSKKGKKNALNSKFESYSDTETNDSSQRKSNFDRPKSSKFRENTSLNAKKKPLLNMNHSDDSTSSSRSRSSSNERIDAEKSESGSETTTSSSAAAPIKVNIERKPPIYKKQLKKASSLEKPLSDSDHERNLRKSHKNDSGNSSDVTDVSPLPTPKDSNSKNPKHRHQKKPIEPNDRDRIDTSIFYDALNSDFNKKMNSALENGFNSKMSRPTSSKLGYLNNSSLNQTIDLSQSNFGTKLMRLEVENQKLYEKLFRESKHGKRRQQLDKPIRLTSSALNRQRDQQRIEKENQLILRRLLDVKPSRDVQKEVQMKDYERNFGYLSLKMLPVSSATSSAMNFNSKSMGSSAISTKRSAKSSANNSRISSAKSGTVKSHFSNSGTFDPHDILRRTASLSRRPEWNERW